jgi:Zn-dependent protease
MNLLPIGILDGGALLSWLVELLRRPVSARVKVVPNGAGVAALATTFMLTTSAAKTGPKLVSSGACHEGQKRSDVERYSRQVARRLVRIW